MKSTRCFITFMVGMFLLGCMPDPKVDVSFNNQTRLTTALSAFGAKIELPIKTTYFALYKPDSLAIAEENHFISNTGDIKGKGFISLGSSPRLKKLNAPRGIALLTDELAILSDQPQIHLLNLIPPVPSIIKSFTIANAKYLNDVVALSESIALVSDSSTGIVHKIEIKGNELKVAPFINPDKLNGNGVNGLAFDDTRRLLFLVTSSFGGSKTQGHIYQASLNGDGNIIGDIERWSSQKVGNGNLDGLAIKDGQLFVSDWEAQSKVASIHVFDIDTKEKTYLIFGNFSSPADISIDPVKNILYVPEFKKNIVSAIALDKLN